MWFKTRVSLVSITAPTEILVHQNPKDGRWSIYTRLKAGPEIQSSSFLKSRKRTVTNPSCYLAIFSDHPSVSEAIGECMAKIETAIRTKADICDLSESGDAQAWTKAWRQVQWPKQSA
jgi:hypothetical protein